MSTRTGALALAGVLALCVAVFAPGCSSGTPTTGQSAKEPVVTGTRNAPTLEQARKAGAIAGAIEKDPNRATEILAEHGVSSETFQALVIDIAKDSLLTEAYEQAKAAAK